MKNSCLSYKRFDNMNNAIDTVLSIENVLLNSNVGWEICYDPDTDSYHITIKNMSVEQSEKCRAKITSWYLNAPSQIMFKDRSDATKIISTINYLIDTYDYATVADLYDLIEDLVDNKITSTCNDNKRGWVKRLTMYENMRMFGGEYHVCFPKPIPFE